jgi:hypothetical protein
MPLLDMQRENGRVRALLFGAEEGAEVPDRLPDRKFNAAAPAMRAK